jgi:hypothetical protein
MPVTSCHRVGELIGRQAAALKFIFFMFFMLSQRDEPLQIGLWRLQLEGTE